MTMEIVEVHLALPEDTAQKLREMAQTRGVSEEAVVEQALELLFGMDDTLKDYWFSVAAMREDWETIPDDWIIARNLSLTGSGKTGY